MAKGKLLKGGHCDITCEIPLSELFRLCKVALNEDLGAVVTIRQTQGTDFPPFIAIETQEFHDKTDAEGEFTNLLTH